MTPFNVTVRVPPLTLATVSSALFGPSEDATWYVESAREAMMEDHGA